jgi:hypothetical protein
MCQHQPGDLRQWRRAMDNREYVRTLLSVKQPEFLALLQSVEREIESELGCEGPEAWTSSPTTA